MGQPRPYPRQSPLALAILFCMLHLLALLLHQQSLQVQHQRQMEKATREN